MPQGYGIYTGSLGTGFGDEEPMSRMSSSPQNMGQYVPTIKTNESVPMTTFGTGAAPAGRSALEGLPDWAQSFTDARRPKGAAVGLNFDNQWGTYFGDLQKQYGKDFVPYAYRTSENGGLGWDPKTANIFTPNYKLEYGAGGDPQTGTIYQAKTLDPVTGAVLKGGNQIDQESYNGGYLYKRYFDYKRPQEVQDIIDGKVSVPENLRRKIIEDDQYATAQNTMNHALYRKFREAQAYYPTLTWDQYVDLYNKNVETRWELKPK